MASATTLPDAAAAEAEDSSEPDTSTAPEQPVGPEQSEAADNSNGPLVLYAVPAGPSTEEVVRPRSWARSAMRMLGSFLWAIFKLGAAALLIHFLIDLLLKSWTFKPAPVDIAPLFEPEFIIQANKTELPIPVPMAEFTPTGTFGSPCQAAATPTPVAKSIVTVMSTPMPTPMPAPTPSAVPEPAPEPEPVAVPDEAFELLNRLFDFPVPDPKPLLTWYFDLPPSSQYAVIVASLLVLWCFSKPLAILAPHFIAMVINYFAAAAMLPLLYRYGFAPKQAMVITVAAICALFVGIWYAEQWLRRLATLCRSNATSLADVKSQSEDNASGLAELRSQVKDNAVGLTGLWIRFEEVIMQSILGWADSAEAVADIHQMLLTLSRYVASVSEEAYAQAKTVWHHATEIDALGREVSTKADLDQTIRILEQIFDRIDGLDTSKADADLFRAAQKNLDSLIRLVENLRAEKADAADLEDFRKQLEAFGKELKGRFDNLQTNKASAEDLNNLLDQVQDLVTDLGNMRDVQDQLGTDFKTLKADIDWSQLNIKSLHETRTQHGRSISRLEEGTKSLKDAFNGLNGRVKSDQPMTKQRISKLEEENADLRRENAELRQDFGNLQGIVTGLQSRMGALEHKDNQHEQRLNQLQDDVTSDAEQKINELRSETNSQHQKDMQAQQTLQDSVDERLNKSEQDVKDAREKAISLHKEAMDSQVELCKTVDTRLAATNKLAENVQEDLKKHKDEVNDRFDGFSTRIEAANDGTSKALQLVEAVESRPGGSIAEIQVDDYIRSKVVECMEDFMVSDKFRAAVNDAHQLTKKQSQRERLRAQVHEAAEELLHRKEIQEKIYANIMERRARDDNYLLGDPPGVVPGGRASSPGIGPSDSAAAPDNMIGNDDPLGDPPGVISGGQATLPGDMSSDDTTTPTIPEESTIPDDVDDHHGTRGVPLGDPPGVGPRGRAASLGGSTSDGPSCDGGTGPRPSGEDDDGTLQPKGRESDESCEPGDLPDEQPHGLDSPEQPGGEQDGETDEETDKEEMDDDDDDDDDDPDDDDLPGPSSGSGGHNGTGGNGNDDQDGDNGGAPRPFTGPGNFRGALGLANSRYAAEPSLDSGTPHSSEGDNGQQDENDDGAEQQPKGSRRKSTNPTQKLRGINRSHEKIQNAVRNAIARVEREKAQQQQGQGLPAQTENQRTAEIQLNQAQKDLEKDLRRLDGALHRAEQAVAPAAPVEGSSKQMQKQPPQGQRHQKQARRLLDIGPGLLQEAKNQLTDLRERLEHAQNEQMQQENQNMQQIENTQQKIQQMLQRSQKAPSQSHPTQFQNHPKQARNQTTPRNNPPSQSFNQPSPRQSQRTQQQNHSRPAQNQSSQSYNPPMQARNQPTLPQGEQDQGEESTRRRGSGINRRQAQREERAMNQNAQ